MKNVARVKEQSSTSGLSSYQLASSGTLYRRLRDEFASGERVRYYAASAADFEEGVGILTYGTPDTLSRDTIIRSSQSGAKINWPAGTRDIFIDPLPGTIPIQDKAGSYTATILDHGSLLRFTGTTATLTLPAAASVGDGFSLEVKNDGSGAVTIDPNGSETINAALTLTLNAGSSGFVRCNGVSWFAVGFAALDLNGLTEETSIDAANDFLPFYDTSAGANRKAKPTNIPGTVRKGAVCELNPLTTNSVAGPTAHGLGAVPDFVQLSMTCLVAELGYSIGDVIMITGLHVASGQSSVANLFVDATNVTMRYTNNTLPAISQKSASTLGTVTSSSWKLTARPFRVL